MILFLKSYDYLRIVLQTWSPVSHEELNVLYQGVGIQEEHGRGNG